MAFFIPVSYVSAAAILLQQPDAGTLSSFNSTPHNVYRLGQGNLVGTVPLSTSNGGVGIVAKGTFSNGAQYVGVEIAGYSDATYTTALDVCGFNVTPAAVGLVAFDGPLTANNNGCPTGDGVYTSLEYVQISYLTNMNVQLYGVPASVVPFSLYGSNNDGLTPAFVIFGQNQSIDPNIIGTNGNPSGISTSSAQALCNKSTATSSNTNISDIVSEGFSFAICYALTFTFVPNQDVLQQFSGLKDVAVTKIPFSYVYEYGNLISTLSATTSTGDFYTIGFFADDIITSTTTPLNGHNLLPHIFIGLSTTTIGQYYPDSIRLSARSLVSFVLYFLFGSWVFYTGLLIITDFGRVKLWQKNFPDDF